MRQQIDLGRVFGIPIHLDAGWFLILALVSWTLATSYFPLQCPGLSLPLYWTMGLGAALLLFSCVVLHELGHSVVAKAYGIPVRKVTLFIFGGVAQLEGDPKRPFTEFVIAIAGPLVSLAIVVGLLVVRHLMVVGTWRTPGGGGDVRIGAAPTAGRALLQYLIMVNAGILAFNLLPGFPLDGGRVLRATLWAWLGNLRKATRIATALGTALGIGLLGLGVWFIIHNSWISGVWYVLLGLYLRDAARATYQDVLVHRAVEGIPVSQVMTRQLITVPSTLLVQQLVDDYLLRYRYQSFPVMNGEALVGIVTTEHARALERSRWPSATVADVMERNLTAYSVRPSDDVLRAIALMTQANVGRLLVIEDGRLAGMVTRRGITELLQMKLALAK